MEIESVLVTGANRGIGLEFVRQLVLLPNPPRFIFASYRNEGTIQALKKIEKEAKETQLVLIKMDVTKVNEIEEARKTIEGFVGHRGLNLLINNAGIAKTLPIPNLTDENLLSHFSSNTVGPILLLQEMLPLLQKAASLKSKGSGMSVSRAAVVNITAALGSVTNAETSACHFPDGTQVIGYMMSKAALNLGMRVIDGTVKDQGILIVLMCPGWVKTDMGSAIATLEVNESVSAMIKTCSQLNESHQGAFIDRNGENIPF